MDIIKIIKEEYDGIKLNSYHVTSKDNLESIIKNGLRIGDRKMQGKGLYSFYDIKHAMRYAMKDNPNNVVIIKFSFPISGIDIILNKEIAEKVYGNNSSLIKQIKRINWDGIKGMEGFIKGIREVYKKNITEEELINILEDIYNDNSEINQRKFWGEMIPYTWNDKLNIILDGYYGIECRINSVHLIELESYYTYDDNKYEFVYNRI